MNKVAWAVFSIVVWNGLYLAAQSLLPNKSSEYYSCLRSLCHALFCIIFGLQQCIADAPLFSIPCKSNCDSQNGILLVSFGYFITNLLWCLYYQPHKRIMLIHHMYSCIVLTRTLFSGTYGRLTTCLIGVLEFSNPFLQARWLIRAHEQQHSELFKIVEIMFVLIFFLLRILIGTMVLIYVFSTSDISIEYKFHGLFIYTVSVAFMWEIYKYIISRHIQHTNVNMTYLLL
ncbi:hypothetical protein RI129_007599 [Pyrocoelia pectoralis]|uniref:TLC domain-containing protein n=1 Tax=Pyrocoelia pectoralis TaxID=417401 RepID=A0AAN7VGR9_9COLE